MSAARPTLPLNDFQRAMRFWEASQPFNGIDAIEARGPVEQDRLRAAAEEELALLGVCYPVARPNGRFVEYLPTPPRIEVAVVSNTSLDAQCAAELNRPFAPGDPLIRLWVVPGEPRSVIGMTWQHWPIDGVSAASLFRRILARFAGAPVGPGADATELTAPEPSAVPLPWRGLRGITVPAVETARELLALARAYPVPRPRPERTALCVRLLALPHPPRPTGATLNDVTGAALFWALAEALPERYRNVWRNRLNLINMFDLRAYGHEAHARAWGLFLAYATIQMPEPRPRTIGALIESVRAQTARTRDGRYFLLSLGGHRVLRTTLQLLPRRWGWALPYQMAPYTAGLTNTRFRAEWNVEPFATRFGRSWRVAPLGGSAPLVADVCSKGNQVSIALTYEAGGVIAARIDTIADILTAVLAGTVT